MCEIMHVNYELWLVSLSGIVCEHCELMHVLGFGRGVEGGGELHGKPGRSRPNSTLTQERNIRRS